MDRPFYELNDVELMNMDRALLEYQLQEGAPPGLVANRIHELAVYLFTARADLRAAVTGSEHRVAWWATYRAALGGLSASDKLELGSMHEFAGKLADMAHGPLEKTPTE